MTIKYSFTKPGVAAFLESALADTFHALDTGGAVENICISVGTREIVIPMYAEQYEELSVYLEKAIESEEEL